MVGGFSVYVGRMPEELVVVVVDEVSGIWKTEMGVVVDA